MINLVYDNEKYLFVFTSNYHGYYIEELFRRNGIKNTFRKAPRAVAKSCHTAIYIQQPDLQKAVNLIRQAKISVQGVFEIIRIGHVLDYKKVKV
ncbi:DUF3343 domain-containing protein [Lutibacter sp. B2]|nr:DUF3343 domain-containing protein [Lutibacter sp. B2]